MKKPVLLVLGLLLIAFISVYFIVPQNITANALRSVDGTDVNVSRFIIQNRAWKKWWPGKKDAADSNRFSYNNIDYTLKNLTNSYAEVLITDGELQLESKIRYSTIEEGATEVSWNATMLSSLNPFARISEFVKIKSIQKDMEAILLDFKKFIEADINAYGIHVKLSKVKDPVMLATNTISKNYPSTETVYALIDKLRKQANAQNATETNKPMLNIHRTDEDEYQVMVALPINKVITPTPGFAINRMLKGGNILETEVKGGRNTIDNAFNQMKAYTKDHHLIAPAMPFESIVTDRVAEKDTAKWVTKVYFPIF